MTDYDIDKFINDDLTDYVEIEVGNYRIRKFTYSSNGLYYLSLYTYDPYKNIVKVYNEKGKLINEIEYDFSSILVTESYIFGVSINDDNKLYLLDKDDPSDYVINGKSVLVSTIAFITLLSSLVIFDFEIHTLKRGVIID